MVSPGDPQCAIVGMMSRAIPRIVLACLSQILLWGQVSSHCLPQGKPIAIVGTVTRVDENGYREWTALRPLRPICILADPDNEFSQAVDDIEQIQVASLDD